MLRVWAICVSRNGVRRASVSSDESGTSASGKAGQKGKRRGGRREARKGREGKRDEGRDGACTCTTAVHLPANPPPNPTLLKPTDPPLPLSPLEKNTVFVPFFSKFQVKTP